MDRHLIPVPDFDIPVQEVAYIFDRYYLNPSERLFLREGRPVELRPKVFETLVVLVSNAGRLVTKSQLLGTLWPDTYVDEVGIARNICALRDTLHDHGRHPRFIETVQKFGYRFVGSVTAVMERRESLRSDGRLFPP